MQYIMNVLWIHYEYIIITIIYYYPWIEIMLIYYSFRLARIYSEYIIPIHCSPTISFLRSRNLLSRMMRSMWQWVSASTCRQSIDLVSHLPCFPTYVQTLCTIFQVGLILGGESYVADLAYDIDANPALFQENVRKLAERVRMICRRLWSIDFTFYILLV